MTKRKPSKPIYMTVRALVDPETGERLGCLVPSSGVDTRLLRERGYRVGSEVRAELKKPRNPKFHRLVHAFGLMLSEYYDECRGKGAHDSIKHMQAKSGVACETTEYNLSGMEKLLRTEPRSLSFDSMEEAEFKAVFDGICNYVTQQPDWAQVPDDAKQAMIDMMGDTFGAS